jgi:hypothetical protein
MSRRTLGWAGVVLCLGLLAATGLVFYLWPWPGVTEANYWRIQMGMTEPEVLALLGGPAVEHPQSGRSWWPGPREGEIDSSLRGSFYDPDSPGSAQAFLTTKRWEGAEVAIRVRFGPGCSVVGKEIERDPTSGTPGLLARLRSWLGW